MGDKKNEVELKKKRRDTAKKKEKKKNEGVEVTGGHIQKIGSEE